MVGFVCPWRYVEIYSTSYQHFLKLRNAIILVNHFVSSDQIDIRELHKYYYNTNCLQENEYTQQVKIYKIYA